MKEGSGKASCKKLVLYHTEDLEIPARKERYTAEGRQYFSGSLYVPDALETICLAEEENE